MSNKKDANRILKGLQKKFKSLNFILTKEDSGMFFIYTNDKNFYSSAEFEDYIKSLPKIYDDIVFMYADYKSHNHVVHYILEPNVSLDKIALDFLTPSMYSNTPIPNNTTKTYNTIINFNSLNKGVVYNAIYSMQNGRS